MSIPNLLIIAGTGTKSGKTTLACKLIDQFKDHGITAIKITPHFHETTPGLVPLSENNGYAIYEENNSKTLKDTSRMLNAGATKVYFAKVWDERLHEVFNEIMKEVPAKVPVICESPALRNFVEPGLFAIISSDVIHKQKDINHLMALPHVMFKLEDLEKSDKLPIVFENGKWSYNG